MSSHFETTPERDPAGHASRTVMGLLGNMILIPVRAFIYGMEMLVRTMQGMQNVTDRSLGVIAGEDSTNGGSENATVATDAAAPPPIFSGAAVTTDPPEVHDVKNNDETIGKESAKMSDTNLNDDMLKLVRYKILFIRRDYEHAFREKEELVFDNMTDSAFTAWKIAEFIQSLDHIEVPEKWLKKVPPYPPDRKMIGGKEVIHSLPESDKKHLRVYFEVLQRYAREKLKYEEDQLDALRGIREAIEKHGVPSGPGQYTSPVTEPVKHKREKTAAGRLLSEAIGERPKCRCKK